MFEYLVNLPRRWKKVIVALADTALIVVALFLALSLRAGKDFTLISMVESWPFLLMLVVLAPFVASAMSVGNIKLSTFDNQGVLKLATFASALTIVSVTVNLTTKVNVPSTVPVIFGFVFFLLSSLARLSVNMVLDLYRNQIHNARPVAVYGGGAAGLQLIAALRQSEDINPVAIVDDNSSMHGVVISGLAVRNPSDLAQMVESGKIEGVLLAMPSVPRDRMRKIVANLRHLNCEIKMLPAVTELVSSSGILESLKPIALNDLLGRASVDLEIPGIAKTYAGRSVLISGAGGSIGSELCRQIIKTNPHRLVLLERSELALYNIDREIRSLARPDNLEIVTVLGSVCDRRLVDDLFAKQEIEIVLHAAAYKHVPLVEDNKLEGLRNNVIGTKVLADAALEGKIERFILISTDKAVRPTNIMGATKRLSEMVVQDLQTRSPFTKFSIVRFGNVLGSSGSVIPLFQQQIANGGPITLTHSEVSRYFISLQESVRLVLLAGSFSTGGDIFALSMGKPIRIYDLARRLIELSGLSVRDSNNPTGDIEIAITGMRPGEKLNEAEMTGENALPTPHEMILRTQESYLSELELAAALKELGRAIESGEAAAAQKLIERWVEGYHKVDVNGVSQSIDHSSGIAGS